MIKTNYQRTMKDRAQIMNLILGKHIKMWLPLDAIQSTAFTDYEITAKEQLNNIMESMEANIDTKPILVSGPDENGQYEILTGRETFEAIKQIQKKNKNQFRYIPCQVYENMSYEAKQMITDTAQICSDVSNQVERQFAASRFCEALEFFHPNLNRSAIYEKLGKYLGMTDPRQEIRIWLAKDPDLMEPVQVETESGPVQIFTEPENEAVIIDSEKFEAKGNPSYTEDVVSEMMKENVPIEANPAKKHAMTVSRKMPAVSKNNKTSASKHKAANNHNGNKILPYLLSKTKELGNAVICVINVEKGA